MNIQRAPSPVLSTTSASIFINNFDETLTNNNSTISISATSTIGRSRVNFWDFEGYSRAFLHERKLIEKEKEEWEVKVGERTNILNSSINYHVKKYENLKENTKKCLKLAKEVNEEIKINEKLMNEIEEIEMKTQKIKSLLKYFVKVQKIIENGFDDEKEFKKSLINGNWKVSLDKIVNLIDSDENIEYKEDSSISSGISSDTCNDTCTCTCNDNDNCTCSDNTMKLASLNLNADKVINEIISKRILEFNEIVKEKTRQFIKQLGWPKIKIESQNILQIISNLQDLLTYGEAIYLLSKRLDVFNDSSSNDDRIICHHPIEWFIEPIRIRFNYHFRSDSDNANSNETKNKDRPTNRLDKPEWYFDHLISLARESVSFLREFIFPCWRLINLDDFLREGIMNFGIEKTTERIKEIEESKYEVEDEDDEELIRYKKQSLLIHHLIEFGKFKTSLEDEFGYRKLNNEEDNLIEKIFVKDEEKFVKMELERIEKEYREVILGTNGDSGVGDDVGDDEWTPNIKSLKNKNDEESDVIVKGDPSAPALKFLALFHSSTVLPYSHLKDFKLRSVLLYKVQSWLLETFHDKCQFDCSPVHTEIGAILKDIGMINSILVICKVLRDDFGESLDYVELSASVELHKLIGYDPSHLSGTCFNRAIEAFKSISDRLSSHLFNFVMDRFLKQAIPHANLMIYARIEEGQEPALSNNLRLAVSDLLEALKLIKPILCSQQFKKLFTKTLTDKLASFMYHGILLKNFFTETGAERFIQDIFYVQGTLISSKIIEFDNPQDLKLSFAKVFEAAQLLKMKEKDPTGPFDGARVFRAVRENRIEDLKRFLEMMRFSNLRIEELAQIFASRRQ